MSDTPKIIQLLMCRNDNVWQGVLLGLGDDGVTYHCQGDTWQPCIPKLAHKEIELAEANTASATLLTTKCRELAEVTKQRDELLEALEDYIANGHSKALQERAKIIVDKAKGGAA